MSHVQDEHPEGFGHRGKCRHLVGPGLMGGAELTVVAPPPSFQLNADCLDDLPLDYDLALGGVGGVGMGGVGVLALEAVVSGASSDGTLSEGGSSVVLDPGVRRMGLPQDYPDSDVLRDSPVTATTDTHTGDPLTLLPPGSGVFGPSGSVE